jgi:membrane protease subunit (stomatin/prohibitin family)
MGTLGEDWGRQQASTILKDLANNQSDSVAATGAGLGMGIGAGGIFGSMAQQVFNPMNSQAQQQNPVEKIKQLKEMLDLGAISQEEFESVKQEILNKLKQ